MLPKKRNPAHSGTVNNRAFAEALETIDGLLGKKRQEDHAKDRSGFMKLREKLGSRASSQNQS